MVKDIVFQHIFCGMHLGCGDPLIGFWPYFRHEYSSGGISANFKLIAGTLTTLFILIFLLKKGN